MKEKENNTRTVGCSFEKLIPDETHKAKIHDAVNRVHKATILATELLNIHIRNQLENHQGEGLDNVFNGNWLMKAFYEVTSGKKTYEVDADLRAIRALMPTFQRVDRTGLTQIIKSECDNLAAVAWNNVWMHFEKRLLSHVRCSMALSDDAYKALTKGERTKRRLHLMQVAEDLGRNPKEERHSPSNYHAWIDAERTRLGLDEAVGDWSKKWLIDHLKIRTKAHKFLKPMFLMLKRKEEMNRKGFSLYPLRRTLVPRHIRFDQLALRQLLNLGASEYNNAQQRESNKRQKVDSEKHVKRPRRPKEDMVEEKSAAFTEVLDLKAAKVRQRHRFDFGFTTDGVCVRLKYMIPPRKSGHINPVPTRGRHSIDELKSVSRLTLSDLHVVGIDPGKREIVVAVDSDDPKGKKPVRYTLRQRQKDQRSLQYKYEGASPPEITLAIEDLAETNSRSSDLKAFRGYCDRRHKSLDACLGFYAHIGHRQRRWKTYIKTQKSEERLYERLRGMHPVDDKRTMVLAYGSWGLVAGKVGVANKRNPPTIGVGLMNKLAKRFVVALTPEQYTSKTCCKCFKECGPFVELEEKKKKKIRGVRRCQNENCKLIQNRDRTGASNIGTQFNLLFEWKPTIHSMSDEKREFLRLESCF